MDMEYVGTIIFIILFFLLMFLGGWAGAKRKNRRPLLWGTLCLFFPLLFVCLELSQSFDENGAVKQEVTHKLSYWEYAALLGACFFIGILFMMIFSLCSFL